MIIATGTFMYNIALSYVPPNVSRLNTLKKYAFPTSIINHYINNQY